MLPWPDGRFRKSPPQRTLRCRLSGRRRPGGDAAAGPCRPDRPRRRRRAGAGYEPGPGRGAADAEAFPAPRLPAGDKLLDCFPRRPRPRRGVADYAYGRISYDGHKGTDIAIRDFSAMEEGMAVLAAAPGVVRRRRDGMEDIGVSEAGRAKAVKGRECGNGVVIGHGTGWTTQYCHMRRGSVDVVTGQSVTAGQRLGRAA